MGQGCSSGKWDIGARNSVRKGPVNTLSHWKGNKQQTQKGPTRLSQAIITVGIAEWCGSKMLTRPQSEHRIGQGEKGP